MYSFSHGCVCVWYTLLCVVLNLGRILDDDDDDDDIKEGGEFSVDICTDVFFYFCLEFPLFPNFFLEEVK